MPPSASSCTSTGLLRSRRRSGQGRPRAHPGILETNFKPRRRLANHLDFQLQLDVWSEKANARTHRGLRTRPLDRLAEELNVIRPLREQAPDTGRRMVLRVPPDPHLRFDTNDYSLDSISWADASKYA